MSITQSHDPRKLSVVISIYRNDNPEWFGEALASIIDQTVKPDQIFITIDGIVPNALMGVIDEYSKNEPDIEFHQITSEDQIGRGDLLAQAVELSRNEIVAIMDSDDVSKPYRFEKQLEIFANLPDIDVVGSWVDEFDSKLEKYQGTRTVPRENSKIVKFARYRNPINQMTVMFRRSAVIAAGNYQTHAGFEDMWLWIRMIYGQFKFYNIQISLVDARAGRNMIARRQGLYYSKSEVMLYIKSYRLGFLSLPKMILNIILRAPLRLLPRSLLYAIYQNSLRSSLSENK